VSDLEVFSRLLMDPVACEKTLIRAGKLQTLLGGIGKTFLVAECSPHELLEMVLVASQARCVPVLGARSPLPGERVIGLSELDGCASESGEPSSTLNYQSFHSGTSLGEIIFATSGTTGEQTRVVKSWSVLLAEAEVLRETFSISDGATFVSFVPPAHIYGFIFGVLLPLVCGSCPEFVGLRDGLGELQSDRVLKSDILVTVPALWSPIREFLAEHSDSRIIFSSGAPWGEKRAAEFSQLNLSGVSLFEVLGSTETGGIGYRQVVGVGDESFKLFSDVEIFEQENMWYLNSSYLFPSELSPLALSDEFELLPQRRFLHKGRRDNVFKYCGKRMSIAEIEGAMRCAAGTAEVRCFFKEDAALPKGGLLYAFVLGAVQDVASIREKYHDLSALPFPDRLFFLKEMPSNGAGKTTFDDLLAAVQKI
jgi:acyl-coenzyme A synthetase/AMP-(fatty) acid ligase